MGQLKRRKIEPKPLGLKDFHSKRNQVVIWHDKGGLGDVLMQRMMFDDFKALMPDSELIFACLPEYMDAARDHPCIAKVLDSREINPNDYIVCYNTCVTLADRYENGNAPCSEHRSDIWAKYCGITLTSHEMRFFLDPEAVNKCREKISQPGKKTVLFAPVSKMGVKTLLPHQINSVVDATKTCNLVGIHTKDIPELSKIGIPVITNISVKEWMCYIAAADYVVSVDTATFHMAGGLKKPLMGIFTFADGKAYGKYFDFILVQKHRDNGDWDCGPCFKYACCPKCKTPKKPCLTEITNDDIRGGLARLFQRWPLEKQGTILA